MRTLLAMLLAAAAFAGCISTPETVDSAATSDLPPAEMPTLPDPIEDSQSVVAGVDPFNFVTGAPCTQAVSACTRYPFELTSNATVDAQLAWTVPANDFDLYIIQDGEVVLLSGNTPPGTSEAIKDKLKPGAYEVVVVAWAVAADTYTLKVAFS